MSLSAVGRYYVTKMQMEKKNRAQEICRRLTTFIQTKNCRKQIFIFLDPKTRKIVQRRYKSSMVSEILQYKILLNNEVNKFKQEYL